MNVFSSYNKKVAAQLAAEATVAARRQDAADNLAVRQLSDIRKTLPASRELPPELQAALPPTSPLKKVSNYTPWIFGGVAAILVGGYLWSRR